MKLIKNIKRFLRKRANRQKAGSRIRFTEADRKRFAEATEQCRDTSARHSQRLLYLQQQLDEAIAEGEYETAAVISDELRWLRSE
jgi:excinuclease UvrABC helicase subunit UvrB